MHKQTLKKKKAAALARMRKGTLSSPVNPIVKASIELPIEINSPAKQLIETIEPTEIEESIEDTIPI